MIVSVAGRLLAAVACSARCSGWASDGDMAAASCTARPATPTSANGSLSHLLLRTNRSVAASVVVVEVVLFF